MPNILNKNKKDVFYIKHRLYTLTSILLIANTLVSVGLLLILYNYIFYLRINIPPWLSIPVISVALLTAHFSYVAFKGLVKEVSNN